MTKENPTKPQKASPKRKALISYISYDQDDFEFKKTDESFLKSYLLPDGLLPQNRHEIWRPSVALAQLQGLEEHYKDLVFNDYYLLTDDREGHKRVREEVETDIRNLAPNLNLFVEDPKIKNPFDTYEVYKSLVEYFSNEKFHRADTEYYVNCTSGTSQIRNCLFLITQMGQIDAFRIDPIPWRNHKQRGKKKDNQYKEDGRRWVKGSYKIVDPRVFADAYRNITEQRDKGTIGYLKHGVITKDNRKLEKIARVIDKIREIKNPKLKAQQAILLTGETGVGKTQLAGNIADALMNEQNKQNLISLNCATIRGADENIQRMELFGCKKGFPNKHDEEKEGVFKKADGKILFLDEIGELHPTVQAMLLAVLDVDNEGHFNFIPLGGDASRQEKSSFLLICGTNRPLEQFVEEGKFRRDLFNRINTWHFELDPLRKHRDDIPANVDSILNEFYDETKKARPAFTTAALNRFLGFANEPLITWDGNFRELNAMVRRMAILSDNLTITDDIVEEEIAEARRLYEAKQQNAMGEKAGNDPQTCNSALAKNDHRSVIGIDTYESLPPLLRAEFDLLAKAIMDDGITDRQELIKRVYGKMTSGGLTHRLDKQFNLRFVKGRLEKTRDFKQ